MGFFSRKKLRKRDAQRQQPGAVEPDDRTDVSSTSEPSGSNRERRSRPLAPTRKSKHPAHSRILEPRPNDDNYPLSSKQAPIEIGEKRLPTSPPSSSPPPKKTEHTTPSPILHKTSYFGMATPPSSSPLFQTSHVPAYNSNRQSRVRFASSGESVTSESEASKVHMMAGSYASSSAFSSSLVMSEEDRRLAAMGMGRADPKSDVFHVEGCDRLIAAGIDPTGC